MRLRTSQFHLGLVRFSTLPRDSTETLFEAVTACFRQSNNMTPKVMGFPTVAQSQLRRAIETSKKQKGTNDVFLEQSQGLKSGTRILNRLEFAGFDAFTK